MIAKVTSKWENGDLVFSNAAGEIARFDESAGTLDIKALAVNGVAISGAKIANGTQHALISDPTGGATTDAEARTAIGAIIDALQAFGIVATS